MKSKHLTPSFYFSLIVLLFIFMGSGSLLIAQEVASTAPDSGLSGGDIFEFLLVAGYIVGVFVLLPWVIYTNMKEKLTVMDTGSTGGAVPDSGLSEDERNNRAAMILDEIEKKLTPFEEEGEDLVTITKGSQARFIKRGIEYIQQKLQPTDPKIIARMNEFITVYEDRTKRVFTGSKWIIGCAVGLGIFMVYIGGISTFIFIHTLGIVFYILSSRTPMYILEKRMNLFGGGGSIVGAIFGGLFIGAGAKHYNIYSDGRKERDYSSEFTGGAVYFLLIAVVAMFMGFMAAALGVVNFLMNYMNNALIPGKPESWYEKTFTTS
ncbi:MAG: hypothetical protein K8R79_08120 [Calditrichales bacterium]|nr:hypothetical protein [Calditrichales bacterium]